MADFRIAVLISGRGTNLAAILQAVQDGLLPARVAVVLSDNPEADGLKVAASHGVETVVVERNKQAQSIEEFHQKMVDELRSYTPDLIALGGYMRMLGRSFLREFPNRVVNIHPSLLPQFRGLEAQRQALEAGVCFSGCTVHLVNEQVDAGAILGQAVVPVFQNDDIESLSTRILVEEHRLYPAILRKIIIGEVDLDCVVAGAAPRSVSGDRYLRSYEL